MRRWQGWAIAHKEELNLTDIQIIMAAGPECAVKEYARAKINGVPFTVEDMELKKKAKDHVIMIDIDGGCGKMFGRALRFISSRIPGTPEANPRVHELVEAYWFKPATPCMNTVIDCPIVMKTRYIDPAGNLWPANNIIPVHIGLAPYITVSNTVKADRWQVLASASDFMSRRH